jgi:uncharacterized protein (UPF0305 family)
MRDLSRLTPEERAWFEEIKDEEPALRDVHEIRLWNYIETRYLKPQERIDRVNALAKEVAAQYGLKIVKSPKSIS